jgi:hypothetical protein
VEFTLGSYALEPVDIDGRTFHEVTSGSVASTSEPGFPKLPIFATLIGLPPDAEATVEVVELTTANVPNVLPAPFPDEHIVPAGAAGAVATPTMAFRPDPRFYEGEALYPSELAELGSAARTRNQRVVSLRVKPIRARGGPGSGLTVATRVVVDVRFRRSARLAGATVGTAPEGEREFFYRGVLNYEQAKAWRNRRAQPVSAELRRHGRVAASQAMKLRVRDVGLVRVRHSILAAKGWTGRKRRP